MQFVMSKNFRGLRLAGHRRVGGESLYSGTMPVAWDSKT